jgi:hypothetical protein
MRLPCDKCGNHIVSRYYEVTKGHNDWGNDSIESIKIINICSDECLRKEISVYIDNNRSSKYINIERR